jgi:MoaA/NifB/PqqE/SkfB family radical SAM enzyme
MPRGTEINMAAGARANPDPRRYFEAIGSERGPSAEQEPICLYLETTNRCNLLCETCPRTFEDLEPPADMSWELFTRIVDQVPRIARVVLHGVGEPMMVKALPRMIGYLKERGAYVLFNTNGTLLTERKGRELIAAGLDELRVSLDAAEPRAFLAVRGKDMFTRIVRNVRAFTALQRAEGIDRPLVSLWLTGLKETIDQLPAFVRLAHQIGVAEIHLQRLVFMPQGQGLARAQSALFEQLDGDEASQLAEAASLAETLGISFNASGATEPDASLERSTEDQPWSLCRRPWTLMYFTAHGRAIPCCIAPFAMRGYDGFTLGDATQQSLRQIWNGPRYQEFRSALLSDTPPAACASCGVRWSL